MTDQSINWIKWAEVAGCLSLSNKQITRAAQNRFSPSPYFSNKSQATRNLFGLLFKTVFEVNLFDLQERIAEVFNEHSDGNALQACAAKMEALKGEGWALHEGIPPNMGLAWNQLRIQLAPYAILTKGVQVCLLYAYHRRSPQFNKDAIRALLYLVRLLPEDVFSADTRVVILDCYKDESWEGSDFASTEPWIARRTSEVVEAYSAAQRFYSDNNPPSGSGRMIGQLDRPRVSVENVDDKDQLRLQL